MNLDRTFAKEIRAANGDGSREAKFTFMQTARDAAREMSTPDVMRQFGDILKKYGRAAVGICVAVTVDARQDRLKYSTVCWAREVLKLWTNRPMDTHSLLIKDNLHPTRIEEYAGQFIALTADID